MKKKGLLFVIVLLVLSSLVYAGTLKVTSEHPFLINGEWIPASELKIGDRLTEINGKTVEITSIKKVTPKEPFLVYNIEAGKYHNFIVRDTDNLSIVVHNSNPLGDPNKIRFVKSLEAEVLGSAIPGGGTTLYHATNELVLLYSQKNGLRANTYFGYKDSPQITRLAKVITRSVLRNRGKERQISIVNERIIGELLKTRKYSRPYLEELSKKAILIKVKVPFQHIDDFIHSKPTYSAATWEWVSKKPAYGPAEIANLPNLEGQTLTNLIRDYMLGTRNFDYSVILGQ